MNDYFPAHFLGGFKQLSTYKADAATAKIVLTAVRKLIKLLSRNRGIEFMTVS